MEAIVAVENGTAIPGLAGLATNRLKNENIQTVPPADATIQDAPKTTITVYDTHINPTELTIIKKEFGVDTVAYSALSRTDYNVVVITGSDYNVKEGRKILNEP